MRLATRLAAIELQSIDGPEGEDRKIRLDSLWKQQPVVLVFIRHFG